MAEVKLTIEEDSSSLLVTEKQEGLSKDENHQQQQQMDPTADSTPPSALCFGQQIAKLNVGRFKLFTWIVLLTAFISLCKGEQKKWEWSAEAAARHNPYAYMVTGNTVWKRMLNMYFTLLVISTGSLVFHWIQRRMTKGLVTLALTDICLSFFSTVVLSIQCWQIMVGHVSVNWGWGFSFPLSLNFVVWCTSALAILLQAVSLWRTVSAMKQTKLWVTTTSNYATAQPNCSALDTAYARFWPIGLQKLAQMLISAFVLMLALFGAIGPEDNRIIMLFFGVCTLVWLLQWAFHTTRTRCFAVNTSDNKGEESPGLALACFVDCLLSSPGLFFFVVMFWDYSSTHHQTGETRFFTWLSLLCGSMFAGTICYNMLLLFRHRNVIGANFIGIWGKFISQLRKVPRSVTVPLRLSVSVNFTVVIKKDEEETKEKKVEDGKLKKEEDDAKKEEENDGSQQKKEEDEVVEEKADEEEDGVSFEEIEGEQEEEETAYCIV